MHHTITVNGHGIAGICLIRLASLRPSGLPAWLGVGSENAAHRIAVEWDSDGRTLSGVYVPRRDTGSRLNALAGGRLFEGYQHHARFDVRETATHLEVAMASDDGITRLAVVADVASEAPAGDTATAGAANDYATTSAASERPLPGSTFATLAEASAFFEAGALGYSDTPVPGRYQGLELRCRQWRVTPLTVRSVRSSFFDRPGAVPGGQRRVRLRAPDARDRARVAGARHGLLSGLRGCQAITRAIRPPMHPAATSAAPRE